MHILPCMGGSDAITSDGQVEHPHDKRRLSNRPRPRVLASDPRTDLTLANLPIPNFYELANGVFRGGHPANDAAFAKLASHGIRTIVNLEDCTSTSARSRQAEQTRARAHGMQMLHFPVSPLFSLRFKSTMRAVRALQEAGSAPVYLHCFFGHERTGFVIALHRFFNEGWSYERAHGEMMQYGFRPWLVPLMYKNFRRWCANNPSHRDPKETD